MASRGADCKVIGIDPSAGLIAEAMSANHMVARGIIGEELASSLANEYIRRKDAGTLYGHQPFGTLVATLVCRAGYGVQQCARSTHAMHGHDISTD